MSFLRPCVIGLFVVLLTAQAATKSRTTLPQRYKQWLDRDVVYIITNEERKAFLGLATDAERDSFIEDFWNVRNPVRGAKQNLYKEEIYKRIDYANHYFGRQSNTPGWMTDMGRTYIEFGKPVSKFNLTGYGQIYPLELWYYENNTGDTSLPPFFYVLFFIPEDIGEYRFYHPVIDGPMKLVRGSQFHSNGDVYRFLAPLGGDIAHAAFSMIPNDPIDKQNFTVDMSGEMLISKIQNLANDPFNVKRIRELRAERSRVTSFVLLNQQAAVEVSTLVLCDPEGQSWLDYALWINDEKFGKADSNGRDLHVTAGFRLTTEGGNPIVDDSEGRAYPAFEGAGSERKFVPFRIASRIPMVPGKYVLHVQVTNHAAGKIYEGERKVTVSGPNAAGLSGPLVISGILRPAQPDPGVPFQYYGVQFIPVADRVLPRNEPLRALYQIEVPSAGDYAVEYVVAHAQLREQRKVVEENVGAQEFRNGRLLKAKTIPLDGMAEGDYRLVINLRAQGSSAVLASANVPFRLVEEPANERLFFLSNFRASETGGVSAYIRALESLALKDREKASEFLASAVDQNPANTYAGQMLVGLYFSSHKYDRVTALYEKMGLNAFRSAPEALAQIGVSLWQAGKAAQARQVIETARSLFPRDALIESTEKSFERLAR
ncbi:MAG TPA: GWxTD domain-containing protein [Bryobacteraceae bacterium]|nr:GWxTD domain-containing protein [Bryobacteraceae bacterium]